jgi:membrane-bound lytic murein transglycosylase F
MNKVILFCLVLALHSCSESPKTNIKQKEIEPQEVSIPEKVLIPIVKDLDVINESNTIKVILTNSPVSYFIYKGEPMGFQYELATRFAKDQGLEIEVVLAESIPEATQLLLLGEGDILATGLTMSQERLETMGFSDRIYSTHQVLVQKKPDNWKRMSKHNVNRKMIRDVLDLEDASIHVKNGSVFKDRIENLSAEIGAPIHILESEDTVSTEDLMKEVSLGIIKYTVADDNTALLGQIFYDNLDIEMSLSFSQQIAWAVRKESPQLEKAMNDWIAEIKKTGLRNILYDKYFGESRAVERRLTSPYTYIEKGKLSRYDDIIKEYAEEIGWDWRLLAAQIFKESRFNPKAKSWVGAQGLMQLMPRTAAAYQISNPTDPRESIKGGTTHIKWLTDFFEDTIEDSFERQKFIIGSYNVGQGHVFDAQRLAEKYGKDPQNWEDVSEFLLKKSNAKYFHDPVVKYGYCRGIEVVTYVDRIYEVYNLYKETFNE